MEIIQGIFNFDNIGDKLKTWAKWSCWITIILSWVGAAIAFLVLLFTKGMLLFAFLVPVGAAIESLLIWVGSWVLYALGQYVEDVHAIRNKEMPPKKEVTTKTTLSPPKDIFASVRGNEPAAPVKRCLYCGDVVKNGRCEMCGKEV
jgi:hypothetical protein